MHQSVLKLLSIASEPIADPLNATTAFAASGSLGSELSEMLKVRNGFYAYESALLVRPFSHKLAPLGILEWNAPSLWKSHYVSDTGEALFFAEDVFGGQYCILNDEICTFDPETGEFEAMSSSLGTWADEIVSDYHFRTGFPLAHAWQVANMPLRHGTRLLPKVPFVCGGKYEIANLYPLADSKGMLFRASIANQIRDLPDGAEIVIKPSL